MTAPTFSASELGEILQVDLGVDPAALLGRTDHTLADLGVDSIGVLALEAVVRDKYGIQLPENAADLSLDQIIHFVSDRVQGSHP